MRIVNEVHSHKNFNFIQTIEEVHKSCVVNLQDLLEISRALPPSMQSWPSPRELDAAIMPATSSVVVSELARISCEDCYCV